MTNYICTTCGTQYEDSKEPPEACKICTNDRQYVGWTGQHWTTLAEMRDQGFRNEVKKLQNGLYQILTEPSFGIGQRALLVKTDSGNLLWDCLSFLDDATTDKIRDLGGVDFIAVSHPHFYSSIIEWSDAFGEVPVYLHHSDRRWVQRKGRNIIYWKGRKLSVQPGVQIVNLGGHFPGSSVLYLDKGPFHRGVLLSGDTALVVKDRRWVSFMYSYPNLLPLPGRRVMEIASLLKPYRFEDIYSGFDGGEIRDEADKAVQRSAKRYVFHLHH
jgi:glyoxylase-like metal-dependent hydrolase (beta-lactamase superfamily II)